MVCFVFVVPFVLLVEDLLSAELLRHVDIDASVRGSSRPLPPSHGFWVLPPFVAKTQCELGCVARRGSPEVNNNFVVVWRPSRFVQHGASFCSYVAFYLLLQQPQQMEASPGLVEALPAT